MTMLKRQLARLLRTKVMRTLVERPLRSLLLWYLRTFGARRDAMWASYCAWQEITRGRWPEAITWATFAIAADPTWADGHHRLGTAYRGAGNSDRARQAYEQGMRAAPNDHHIALALGDLELDLERYAAAETAFRRALALRPEDPNVLWKLAQAVGLQGRNAETEQLLERARALAPNDARALAMLGIGRYARGDVPGAVALLTQAIERERGQPLAHYYLALALADLGRHEEGLVAARRAAALEPDNEEFLTLRARLARASDPFGQGGHGRDASA